MNKNKRIENSKHLSENEKYDETRHNVLKEKGADTDHDMAVEEFLMDPLTNEHLSLEERIALANNPENFQEIPSGWRIKRDENGNIKTYVDRTGKKVPILVKGARRSYDAKRPKGSKEKGTDMDHIIPAKEIILDLAANAHLSLEERVKLANSPDNLQEIPSRVNQSKGDKNVEVWLDDSNSKGQKTVKKPKEAFNDRTTKLEDEE